jgi:MbtH protein
MVDETSENENCIVLVNGEEQYSLWPAWKAVPSGWRSAKEGTRQECLGYIDRVWTDLRPASLRKAMSDQ